LIFAAFDAEGGQARRVDSATLASRGAAAMEERRFGDAFEAFSRAAELDRRDPALPAGAGSAAAMMGRNAEAQEWLRRALTLAPQLSEVSLLLGELQYRVGQVAEAIATYEAALKYTTRPRPFQTRLAEWRRDVDRHQGFTQRRDVHFVVQSEGATDDLVAQQVVAMLEAEYRRIGEQLATYPTQPIVVVLYGRETFRTVMQAPDWAAGAYDGRIRVPARGALERPDDLRRVLAHEFVHALVANLGGPRVPAWLNEGLASVLERGDQSWAAAVLERTSTRIPLTQLQDGFGRLSEAGASLAYAQSGDAVARLLRRRGPSAVVALLRDLAAGVPFSDAFQQRMQVRLDEFEAEVMRP
jgi:tetratricopeptide (TPR) repeat protein